MTARATYRVVREDLIRPANVDYLRVDGEVLAVETSAYKRIATVGAYETEAEALAWIRDRIERGDSLDRALFQRGLVRFIVEVAS